MGVRTTRYRLRVWNWQGARAVHTYRGAQRWTKYKEGFHWACCCNSPDPDSDPVRRKTESSLGRVLTRSELVESWKLHLTEALADATVKLYVGAVDELIAYMVRHGLPPVRTMARNLDSLHMERSPNPLVPTVHSTDGPGLAT